MTLKEQQEYMKDSFLVATIKGKSGEERERNILNNEAKSFQEVMISLKVLEIVINGNVDMFVLKTSETVETYNDNVLVDTQELEKEEFTLLKEYLNNLKM